MIAGYEDGEFADRVYEDSRRLKRRYHEFPWQAFELVVDVGIHHQIVTSQYLTSQGIGGYVGMFEYFMGLTYTYLKEDYGGYWEVRMKEPTQRKVYEIPCNLCGNRMQVKVHERSDYRI